MRSLPCSTSRFSMTSHGRVPMRQVFRMAKETSGASGSTAEPVDAPVEKVPEPKKDILTSLFSRSTKASSGLKTPMRASTMATKTGKVDIRELPKSSINTEELLFWPLGQAKPTKPVRAVYPIKTLDQAPVRKNGKRELSGKFKWANSQGFKDKPRLNGNREISAFRTHEDTPTVPPVRVVPSEWSSSSTRLNGERAPGYPGVIARMETPTEFGKPNEYTGLGRARVKVEKVSPEPSS